MTTLGLFLFSGYSDAQTNIIDSILYQGYNRIFITHIPPDYTGSDSVPLVFVLHGGGGTANGMISFTEFDLVSDTAGFITVFPQGAVAASTGGYTWADGRGTPADEAGVDDVGFISALIDHLDNTYKIIKSKIYACGMSNGGFMSQRLAVELNNRLAAVATVCATIDSSQVSTYHPSLPIPVLLINGDDDPFVPFNGGNVNGGQGYAISSYDLFNFWIGKNNCTGQTDTIQLPDIVTSESSTVTKIYNSNCSCNSQVILYRVNGGGHTWPGVPGFLYELIAGETNEDIHASVEIWEFFKTFVNCETTGISKISQNTLPLKVFPNPADGIINIVFSNESDKLIRLIDLKGKTIFEDNCWQPDFKIDISNLRKGFYLLVVQSEYNFYTTGIVKK